MRVLHAVTLHSTTHAFGGPVRVALNLCQGLRERGHDARLTALADGFPRPLPEEVEGVPARLHQARRVLPLGFSGLTSPSLLAGAHRLVRRADVVHVHLARDLVTLPVALAALRAGRPLVLQTHGMVDPSERLSARLLDAVAVRRVLRAAAVLHLTTRELRDLHAVVGGTGLDRAVRLVNGVPAQPEGPAPRARRASSTRPGCRPGSARSTWWTRHRRSWPGTRRRPSSWPDRTRANSPLYGAGSTNSRSPRRSAVRGRFPGHA